MVRFRNFNVPLTEDETLELLVCLLLLGQLQQLIGAVDTVDVVEALLFQVLAGEAFATADLEDHGVERILRAQLRYHHGADFRWEAGLDELLLVARRHLVEVELKRVFGEDLRWPLLCLLGIFSLLDDLLLVEELPEAFNRRPEVDIGPLVEGAASRGRGSVIDLRQLLDDVWVPFEAISREQRLALGLLHGGSEIALACLEKEVLLHYALR